MPSPTVYDCREAFARLDDYLDSECGPEELARVRAHLEVCATCAEEFRFEARVLEVLKARIATLHAPAALRERVDQAVARSRREDGSAPQN